MMDHGLVEYSLQDEAVPEFFTVETGQLRYSVLQEEVE
jgi:hypothetical protein